MFRGPACFALARRLASTRLHDTGAGGPCWLAPGIREQTKSGSRIPQSGRLEGVAYEPFPLGAAHTSASR